MKEYAETEYVQGLMENRDIQNALYKKWKTYFEANYRGVFFNIEERKTLIIHNTYTKFWLKVRDGKIYVKNGKLMYSDNKPMACSLTTYMMGIAKLDNKELVRDVSKMESIEEMEARMSVGRCIRDEATETVVDKTDEYIQTMHEITAELISDMSARCCEVLTMFYYNGMNLDSILDSMKTFNSKDALKTFKNKCLDKLKTEARRRYSSYLGENS